MQNNTIASQMAEIKKQRRTNIISLILLLAVVIGSTLILEFDFMEALAAIPSSIAWMVQNFYPVAESFRHFPTIVSSLIDTVLMAVAASTIASLVAYGLALLGSDVTKVNNGVAAVIKAIASFFRNIPDIVWSMIFLFSFGMNVVTGFLALLFVTIGTLTRAFIATIENSASDSVEALKATGSNWFQIIGQSIIPSSIAGVISWILYAIENNVRSATLIGILTGSGIGYIFDLYYKQLDYHACALVTIGIVVVVLFIQWVSTRVRRSIL